MTYADIKNLSDRLAELREINGPAPMPSHTTALLLLDEVEELREYIEELQTNEWNDRL